MHDRRLLCKYKYINTQSTIGVKALQYTAVIVSCLILRIFNFSKYVIFDGVLIFTQYLHSFIIAVENSEKLFFIVPRLLHHNCDCGSRVSRNSNPELGIFMFISFQGLFSQTIDTKKNK